MKTRASDTPDVESSISIYRLGQLDLEEGRIDTAIERLRSALEIAGRSADEDLLWRIHRSLSEALAGRGEFDRAIEHLELSHTLREAINTRQTEERVRELEAENDVDSARREAEIHRLRNVELARALSDLKLTQTRLIQAERVVSLGSLTAGVAHEINNPVNFVLTSLPPLGRDYEELAEFLRTVLELRPAESEEERRERIRMEMEDRDVGYLLEEIELLMNGMTTGIARTREIIQGLSHFAPESGGDRRRHDVRELIAAAAETARRGASEAVRFIIEDEGPIEVECDEVEIRRLLENILDNAIQSIEGRGSITIATTGRERFVSIAISDTGCGMSEEVGRRIFEPFFTTRDVGAGVGLGLSIAYAIARRHRGEISVTSIEGKGSTFVVTLPLGPV